MRGDTLRGIHDHPLLTKPDARPMFKRSRTEFLIDTLAPARRTRVVDIGANPLGPTPYKNLLEMDGCDVWGFEPQQEPYEQLLADAGPREHYLPHAVGDGQPGQLHLCRGKGFTSMLAPNRDTQAHLGLWRRGFEVTEVIPFDTKRLDDLTDLPTFDLLKIDIQGGECAVFDHGRSKLSEAVAVISEVAAIPIYEDQPLLDDQMRSLRQSGYHLHKFMTFQARKCQRRSTNGLPPDAHSNQLIDGDGIFIRNLLALESHDDEALKHLAILADAVFGSHDLAAMAMGVLADRDRLPAQAVRAYVKRV